MSIYPEFVPELPSGILLATAAGLGSVVQFRRQVLGKALARFGFHQRSIP
jgi:hypothetical protein